MLAFLSLFLLCTGHQAMATEVDSFTDRSTVKEDSLALLDQEMNRRILAGIQKANQRDGCAKKELHTQLGYQLTSGIKGILYDLPA